MELFIIGAVVASNIIFILFKFDKGRKADATLDLTLLVIITALFSGSYASLVVGTVASLIISIYLYANPPNIPSILEDRSIDPDDFLEELKHRTSRRY